MDTLVTQASNQEWWISVVVVGIVINLVSTLLSTFIQRRYSWLVRSWSERTDKLAKERRNRIEYLAHSDYDLSLAMINLNKMRLDNIFDFILCAVMLGFAANLETPSILHAIAGIAASISIMMGLIGTSRYGQESLLVTEAKLMNQERKLNKVHATNDTQPSIPDVIE